MVTTAASGSSLLWRRTRARITSNPVALMGGTSIVALDAMSGDRGPQVAAAAALASLAQHPSLSLIVVGQRETLEPLLASGPERFGSRLRIEHAAEVVAMEEA